MPLLPQPSETTTSRSSRYRIEVATTPQGVREQLCTMVRERRDASEKYSQPFRRKLPEWYDLWRGFTTGSWTPTKNNVWIPLIYSTIWGDVARKVATAYSRWPIVSFAGYGPDDAPVARKQEALVNAQMADADIIAKEIVTLLGGDLYGTAVSLVMWDHKEEMRRETTFKHLPLSGETVRMMQENRVVTFDGPNYRNVDLLDAFPQPGFREINGNQGMAWFIVRYYLDIDDCLYLASSEGGEVFNMAEVQRLIREDGSTPRMDEGLMRRFNNRMGIEPMGKDKYTRPVEILEHWGRVPNEFGQFYGGSVNTVTTVMNERFLARAADNPFNHRQKPLLAYRPTPDLHYFHAPGKAEIAHQMQVAANRFVNHQLDAADLGVHPTMLYDRNKGINTRNLWVGPGRVIGVDGPPGDAIVPVPFNAAGIQIGSEMTRSMWNFIQMGTGVLDDTVMGIDSGGSDRQTAREFMGRREASGTRLMLESVLYDTQYLEKLANMFCAMNLQFLELPREVLILGQNAIKDPVTGKPIDTSRVEIDGSVLERQYAAKANGTTMSMSLENQKANMMLVLQTIAGAQPAVAGAINMTNFVRELFHMMGFGPIANDLVQEMPQMAELMAQQGMQPGQVPGDDQGLMQLMGGGMPSGPASGQVAA